MDTVILREEVKATLRKYKVDLLEIDYDSGEIIRELMDAYDQILYNEFGYLFDPNEIKQIPRIAAMKKDFEQVYDNISVDHGYISYHHEYITTYNHIKCIITLIDGTVIKGKSIESNWNSKEINIEARHPFLKQIVRIDSLQVKNIEIIRR